MANSEQFRKMAERIDHNAEATFGGAAVIVPPAQGGETVELLILDAKGDPAQFWGTILTRAQMEIQGLQDKQQIIRGFGAR